jgi:hypothetical protein
VAKKGAAIEIGTVWSVPLRRGGFGACHLIEQEKRSLDVVALDFRGDAPPTLADLRGLGWLRLDHHANRGAPARLHVEGPPPPELSPIGVLAVDREVPAGRSYGLWGWFAVQIEAQARWAALPDDVREHYAHCHEHGPKRWSARIGSGDDCTDRVEPGEPFDWSCLDALGCLTELDVRGDVPGLLAWARRKPLLRILRWQAHGHARIDARGLDLDELSLDVPEGGLELAIDGGVDLLALLGEPGGDVRVAHPHDGDGLALELRGLTDALSPPVAGLARLSELHAHAPTTIDLRRVTAYPALQTLRLDAGRGRLEHPEALAQLPALRRFELSECYDFDPQALPARQALPALQAVELDGVRKTAAAVVKTRWAGVPELTVSGAKTEAWLRANLQNPFHGWVDHHPSRVASRAATAFRQALTQLGKCEPGDTDGHREVVATFLGVFNALDEEHGLHTVDREEVYDALDKLFSLAELDLDGDTLETWFDELRDF